MVEFFRAPVQRKLSSKRDTFSASPFRCKCLSKRKPLLSIGLLEALLQMTAKKVLRTSSAPFWAPAITGSDRIDRFANRFLSTGFATRLLAAATQRGVVTHLLDSLCNGNANNLLIISGATWELISRYRLKRNEHFGRLKVRANLNRSVCSSRVRQAQVRNHSGSSHRTIAILSQPHTRSGGKCFVSLSCNLHMAM